MSGATSPITLLGVFNPVCDFSGAGDGIYDDAGSIAAAMGQANRIGGIVWIPPGRYKLNSSPSFSGMNNVTLFVSPGASFVGTGSLPAASGSNGYFTPGFSPSTLPQVIAVQNATGSANGQGVTLQAGNGGPTGATNGGIITLKGGSASGAGVAGYVSIPAGGGGLQVADANLPTTQFNGSVSGLYVTGSAPSNAQNQFGITVDTALNPSGSTHDGGAILAQLVLPAAITVARGVTIKVQPPSLKGSAVSTTLDGIFIATWDPADATFGGDGTGTATTVNGIEIQSVKNGSTATNGILLSAVGTGTNTNVVGLNIGTLLGATQQPIAISLTPGATVGGATLLALNPGNYGTVAAEVLDVNLAAHTLNITAGYATQRSVLIGQTTLTAASGPQNMTVAVMGLAVAAPTVSGTNVTEVGVFAIGVLGTAAALGNIAGTVYGAMNVANHTVTLNNTTSITSTNGLAGMHLGVVTFAASSGTPNLSSAVTLDIVGPPILSGGTTATILQAIRIQAGSIARGYATPAFSAAVTITVTAADIFKVAATSNTASTFTPSAAGTNGQEMTIIITADGTGGNVITFASTFKSAGTLTTTASKGHTISFVSDGTNWWETRRVLAL